MGGGGAYAWSDSGGGAWSEAKNKFAHPNQPPISGCFNQLVDGG